MDKNPRSKSNGVADAVAKGFLSADTKRDGPKRQRLKLPKVENAHHRDYRANSFLSIRTGDTGTSLRTRGSSFSSQASRSSRGSNANPREVWREVRARLYTGQGVADGRGEDQVGRRREGKRPTLAPGISLSTGLYEFLRTTGRKLQTAGAKAKDKLRQRSDTLNLTDEMVAVASDEHGQLQMDSLGKHGFTTEDLSRVFYQELKENDLPIFLDHICFHPDGGLSSIGTIWDPQKYLWFAMTIAFCVYNMYFLISINMSILTIYSPEDLFNVMIYSPEEEAFNQTYALSNHKNVTADALAQVNSVWVRDLRHVDNPHTRKILLNITAGIAIWEMLWILMKVCYSLRLWRRFLVDTSEYRAFNAIIVFFQKLLPQFCTFSAIKLMVKIHPSLVYNEFLHFKSESPHRGTFYGSAAIAMYFFAKSVLCACASVAAFATKMLAVGLRMVNPRYHIMYRIALVISLMIQCVGVVFIDVVLQDRLFLFVFGGQDAAYQDDEHALKNVYESRLAKRIWDYYWVKGERLKAIILFATFDHYDLQKLLIKHIEENVHRSSDQTPQDPEAEQSFLLDDGPLAPVEEDSSLGNQHEGHEEGHFLIREQTNDSNASACMSSRMSSVVRLLEEDPLSWSDPIV